MCLCYHYISESDTLIKMCSFSFFKILFSKQQRANDHFLFKAINKLSSIKESTIHQKENSVYPIFFWGGVLFLTLPVL